MDIVYIIETLGAVFHTYGYLIVFVGSFIESTPLGWAVPGSLILALGGFYSWELGKGQLPWIIFSGWFGMFLTFLGSYILGKKSGFYLINKFRQEKNADIAKHLLQNHGPSILITSMLANFTRFWMAYVAGSQNYDFKKFSLYASISSLLWTSLVVVGGFMAGSQKDNLEHYLKNLGYIGWGILIIAIGTIVYFARKQINTTIIHEHNSTK